MSQIFEFGKIVEDFSKILEDSKKIVSNYDNEIVESLINDIEEIQNQKLLTIAFIGQYSSGKSTIISALTGNKSVKIDADIATDKTTDYPWNNVLLIDTPGLFTDRQDHDDITYKKIKESDLLVYCLTSDLFDDIILKNFKKIAFEEKQKNKMMVVINKMSMESGKYDELKKNYEKSLNDSLETFKINEFPLCFIDAADYIEGVDENEEELKKMSHFDDFIELINHFIKKNKIWAKIMTPIYRTISFIDNSILSISSKDNKEFLILVNRIEKEVRLKKQSVHNRVSAIVMKLSSNIVSYSNDITSKIGEKEIDFDNIQKEIDIKIKNDIEETQQKIQKELNESIEQLNNTIKELFDSDLGKYVLNSINNSKLNISNVSFIDFTEIMSNFSSIRNITECVAKNIKNFIGVDKPLILAKDLASNNRAVELVKNIGHFFGAKFKPYEAINIVKNMANISKFLGPILTVVSSVLELANFIKDEQNAKKLSDAKNECYNEFLKISKEIENQFDVQLEYYIKEVFDKILEQIKDLRTKMINEKEISESSVLKLKEYKKELEKMVNCYLK